MDSAQTHTKYVKLPREGAAAPEAVAEVKEQLFDGFLKRLVELFGERDWQVVAQKLANALLNVMAEEV